MAMLKMELEPSDWQLVFILMNAGATTLQAATGPPLLAKMSGQLQQAAQQPPQGGNGAQSPQPDPPSG